MRRTDSAPAGDPPGPATGRLVRLLDRTEVRYLVVGGANTAIGLGVFALLYLLWGETLHYLGALLLAYGESLLLGFVLHRRLVFQVRGRVLGDFVGFVGVQLSAFALNAALLPLLVEVARLPVLPAQVLSLALVVAASYAGHRLVSFRRPASTRVSHPGAAAARRPPGSGPAAP